MEGDIANMGQFIGAGLAAIGSGAAALGERHGEGDFHADERAPPSAAPPDAAQHSIALPRIAAVLAERNGAITNDIAAADELKLKAAEAEDAYKQALADARSEAQKIAAAARAEIQAEVEVATEKADAEIAARTAESQARIAEIRDSAMESVEVVARDTAGALVAALGRSADDQAIAAAVEAQIKGRAS